MITIPVTTPDLFKSIERDFGTTVAASLWSKIARHFSWYNLNVPVGLVMFFHGAQRLADGTPGTLIDQPLAGEWQFMDGSVVSNSESPLDGETLPNLRERFPFHDSSTIGITGGSDVIDLAHTHGIAVVNDRTDVSNLRSSDSDIDVAHGGLHTHPVGTDLTTVFKRPRYQELQAFIRIGGFLTSPPAAPTDGLFQGVDDENSEFGDIVSQELAKDIADTVDYLVKSIPIGQISPIMTNITGVPTPDPNIWQLCNGSEITNVNSPLRSVGGLQRFTPDLQDKFIRFVSNLGIVGQNFGSNTTSDFAHDHDGLTGDHNAPVAANTVVEAANTLDKHAHGIDQRLIGPFDMRPLFITLKFFMKIQ